jgi:hypothetical protein
VVEFSWSGMRFKGVVEKVDVTYLMFSSDGTPLRAKVSLAMKEWKDEYSWSAGDKSSHSLPDLELVTTQAGDTASSVAQANNADVRQICEDNNIDDPMAELEAGVELIVDSFSSWF